MIQQLTARDARLSRFRYYDLLVHIFVVILLVSNLVGQKICLVPGIPWARVSGAQLLFPLTYIFADVFTEVTVTARPGAPSGSRSSPIFS